jgi:KDO2-lipid IV(A) lauroyltransferase
MLFLWRWLSRRPLGTLHRLGGLLGWLAWGVSREYRQRLRAHAALAAVPASVQRASVAQAGQMVAELPWVWLMPPGEMLGARLRWQGEGVIEQALAAGRGIVLMTPHIGSFEVAGRAYAERYGTQQLLTVLYRPARQPWLREIEETARARPAMATAPATLAGVRQMLRALRRGQTVGLLPDQVPPEGQGVWAPFFGRPAYTMTLAARLVQQTGATPLLLWSERLPGGQGFLVHAEAFGEALPPAAPPGSAPAEADAALLRAATAINRAMERVIRQCPAQYLWAYERYKAPRRTGVEPSAPPAAGDGAGDAAAS